MTAFLCKLFSGLLVFFNLAGACPVSALPNVPAGYDDALASKISSTATSMTLVSGEDRAGNPIVGFTCYTIDEGSPSLEYVCGTASGTAVTSLTRGINPQNPNTTSSALAFNHGHGANVKITDYPFVAFVMRMLNGSDTLPAKLTYASTIATSSFSTSKDIVDKEYADGLSFSGAPNGSTSTKGIYQEATKAQTAAGTATGTTGADLIAPASYFNATPSPTTTVPVTSASGTLAAAFIDQTAAYSWTGSQTYPNTTSSVLITSATGTITGIKSGTSGNFLEDTGSGWTTAQPVSRVYKTGNAVTPLNTNTTLVTSTMPILAATTTFYHFALTITGNNANNQGTTTISLSSGGSTTTIMTCLMSGAPTNSSLGALVQGDIAMEGSTSTEAITVFSPNCGSSLQVQGGQFSVNLGATTTMTVQLNNTGNANPTNVANLAIYAL